MFDHTNKHGRFLLVYGSQTGQAQAIAEEIAEKAPSFGLVPELHSLEDTGKKFDIEKERCIVIITSTTGDGDPPGNAEKFMRRIKKRTLPHDYLASLHYALLGLGDSNYSNFCRFPRDLDSRLADLGAHRFYLTGLADDGVGLELVAEPWLEGLYLALQKFLAVGETQTVSESVMDENVKTAVQQVINNNNNHNKANSTNSAEPSGTNPIPTRDGLSNFIDNSSAVASGAEINHQHEPNLSDKNFYLSADTVNLSLQVTNEISVDNHLEKSASSSIIVNNSVASIEQTHVITALAQTGRSIASQVRQNWPETPCSVDSSVSDSPNTSPSLAHSEPPLLEQSLTVPALPPPYLSVTFGGVSNQFSDVAYQNGCKLPSAASDIYTVQVLSARVLTTSDAVKKTLLLKLHIENLDVTYSPGDSVSVICPNNSSEVTMLLDRLGYTQMADDSLTISVIPDTKKRRAAIPPYIHPVSTLWHIFTTCLSIRDPPAKAFIRALIEHTTDAAQVRRMQELCSKEGVHDYLQFIREPSISLLDFLYSFPSCKPPVTVLLEHLPRLQPRPYSLCSCQETSPGSVDIVFNVLEIAANKNKGHLYQRRGVCTGWLDDITYHLQSGKDGEPVKIPIFLRANQHFRPPDDLSKPLIMIGPGTGVAPFVGFLKQRAFRKCQMRDGQSYGTTWLFYGCRNKDKDYLFRETLEQFEADGTLTKLCVAFSRDNTLETSTSDIIKELPPRYIQDLLRVQATNIVNLLMESEALVYVCGDAKNMAKDVTAAFEDIIQSSNGMSADDAHMFIMKKRIHKTYLEDVWV